MRNSLYLIWNFLKNHWNKILASISLIGTLVFNFIPNSDAYFNLFVFLGANAIIWTLIEIKVLLEEKKEKNFKYLNMREARPDIVRNIKREIGRNKEGVLQIDIIGGRIRTISDLIREIKDDIVSNRFIGKNVLINIFTLNPDFFLDYCSHPVKGAPDIIERNTMYSQLITRFKQELESFNNIKSFSDNNISITVSYYNSQPFLYAYLIGNRSLFWGFFTYDFVRNDFLGPENACFYLEKGMSTFDDYYFWLSNRVQLFSKLRSEKT